MTKASTKRPLITPRVETVNGRKFSLPKPLARPKKFMAKKVTLFPDKEPSPDDS
jgi:hypothetical protein